MNKLMSITEKQILRGRILQICNQAEPLGAGTEIITAALKKEGYTVNKDNITDACQYLAGKGFVNVTEVRNEILEISRHIARITPSGIDVLEGTKTVEGIEL